MLAGIFAHIAIEQQLQEEYGGSNGYDVRSNIKIPGGGKERTLTGDGWADLIMKANGTYYVYEIKPNSDYGRATGYDQLDGYVEAIKDIIQNGGSIGKYGQTSVGELVAEGDLFFTGTTESKFLPGATIVYYTYGDGLIWYDIVWPKPEPDPVEELDPDEILENLKNLLWTTAEVAVIAATVVALVIALGITVSGIAAVLTALIKYLGIAMVLEIINLVGRDVLESLFSDGGDSNTISNQPSCLN